MAHRWDKMAKVLKSLPAARYKKRRLLKFASDLHLEYRKNITDCDKISSLYNFQPRTDSDYYLALLGDISNGRRTHLKDFLSQVSKSYKEVFYVLGNHEYYNQEKETRGQIYQQIANICLSFPNVQLLENRSFKLEEITIVGTTLWSHIADNYRSGDLLYIWDNDGTPLTNRERNIWNHQAIKYLTDTINSNDKVLVLTHHAPLFNNISKNECTSNPKHHSRGNAAAFHNDLTELVRPPVMAWLYGHTHYCSHFTRANGTIVATNQLGYHKENLQFDPDRYLDLDRGQIG